MWSKPDAIKKLNAVFLLHFVANKSSCARGSYR